jgi:hypothetical protein
MAARERIKIARGAVSRMGPVLRNFLLVLVAWMLTTFWVLPALHVLRGGAVFGVGMGGLLALVAGLIVFANLPGHVEIGADGLFVNFRDSSRYIRFDTLAGVHAYTEHTMGKTFVGATLRLHDGTEVKIPIGEDHFGGTKKAASLSARLDEALRAHRARAAGEHAALLERGERSPEEWLGRLRSIGEGANASTREAPIDPDRLWRIVEDPMATAATRAGAAAALSQHLTEPDRQRLRVAAEATAAPKLRIALESAAAPETDDAALTAALAEVEEDAEA